MLGAEGNVSKVHYVGVKCEVSCSQSRVSTLLGEVNNFSNV